jgi:hypothetical protein
MKAIIIEIRDAGTFIPALAVQLGSSEEQERWLLAMAGYGRTYEDQSEYVVLCKINGGSPCKCAIDPVEWGQNPRTYYVAHRYVQKHFSELEAGAVVDVQFILGETATPKTTDRHNEVTA